MPAPVTPVSTARRPSQPVTTQVRGQSPGGNPYFGGGGNNCNRADHGIGVTEANDASFSQNFGRDDFAWESTAKAEELRSKAGAGVA